ncbi:putative lipoprotein YiaD [Polaribacter huanghezhanensis]|uniref:OmpA family protein n=1 Tax=Polaribacter huanghezhanensis TaxID=1354726 RepID=UPI00264757D4|nr:OmpA family protein [Polaribacter huanghezhanensis]WKD85019.1 putative lipoprotein YiaD [Polaribacter huanghezhanensis]
MLDDVAEIMLDIVFNVFGYTDDIGTEEYNLKLSERRANKTRNRLIEKSVEPNRIIAKGFGKTNPSYGNDTPEGKQLNRRVEIKSVGYYEN